MIGGVEGRGGCMTDYRDEQDKPGIKVPPPLIYVLPLILGLLLDRKAHVPLLPRGAARSLGWPLLVGGVLLSRWFLRTMRKADAPVRTDGSVPLHPQPGLPLHGHDLRRNSRPAERPVGHPIAAVGALHDPARGDRARGALPRAGLRGGVLSLQGACASLGLVGHPNLEVCDRLGR